MGSKYNMNRYKNFFITIVSLVTISGFGLYRLTSHQYPPCIQLFELATREEIDATVNTLQQQNLSVVTALKDQLQEQHEKLLNRLQNNFKIENAEWCHMLNNWHTVKGNDCLCIKKSIVKLNPKDHPLLDKARKLLAEYSIDPERVQVKAIHNPQSRSSAAAYQGFDYKQLQGQVIHLLEINIPVLSQRTKPVQEAILRHEIMHLLNYDPLKLGFIEQLLSKHGITHQDLVHDQAYCNINKHIEFRADLLAACHNVKTALAFQENFNYLIETHPEIQNDPTYFVTHPSDRDRLQAVTQLAHYMQTEQQAIVT